MAAGVFTPRSEVFLAAPWRSCEKLWSYLADPAPVLKDCGTGEPEVVYFRAVTDGKKHISSFDLLSTEASDADAQRLLAYGKENLTVWSLRDPAQPLEVYGSLMVSNGSVGYMIEGASWS